MNTRNLTIALSIAVAALAGMAQAQVVVTSTNDSGPGSLRDAITFAASGSTINFATNLSGQTIFLTSGQLLVTNNLTIDASALPGGLTINGNQTSRLFYIQTNATVALNSLTLTNGYIVGTNSTDGGIYTGYPSYAGTGGDGYGGGIYNAGTLTLNQSTLSGCTAIGGLGGLGGLYTNSVDSIDGGFGGYGCGGGIYNAGTLTLNQSTFSGNSAIGGSGGKGGDGGVNGSGLSGGGPGSPGQGGCIYNVGTVTVNQSRISGNWAIGGQGGGGGNGSNGGIGQNGEVGGYPNLGSEGDGGGIYNQANLTINQTTVSGNVAIGGAGGTGGNGGNGGSVIYGGEYGPQGGGGGAGTPGGNGGSGQGGGILNNSGMTANKCTLSGNSATGGNGGPGGVGGAGSLYYGPNGVNGSGGPGYGGGICDLEGLTLNECTIAGNSATGINGSEGYGGGIFEGNYGLAVNQSTVSGNSAVGGGAGGTGYSGGISVGVAFNLFNSIVAGNNNDSLGYGQYVYLTGNNITNGNPLLAPLGNYGGLTQTMPPLPGSPAIDAGSDSATNAPYNFTTDQRGLPRLSGQHVDIGAVEVQLVIGTYPPSISGAALQTNGTFKFNFTNVSGTSFTVLASTNVALPLSAWLNLGPAGETPPGSGRFQFTDPQATNYPQRFYRVCSP